MKEKELQVIIGKNINEAWKDYNSRHPKNKMKKGELAKLAIRDDSIRDNTKGNYLSQWISGIYPIPSTNLVFIAEALKVKVMDLFKYN